ncbi:hypothetical protein N8766_05585, partial [bacterium]|nr:hypothetical protein [bacterium]
MGHRDSKSTLPDAGLSGSFGWETGSRGFELTAAETGGGATVGVKTGATLGVSGFRSTTFGDGTGLGTG